MDSEFIERLKKAMADKKITASELSRLSGVGKSDISYYLKGRYVPKQDKCYMLAKALGVDPGWLMTGVEQKTEAEPLVVYDSDKWRLIIKNMSYDDYVIVVDAFRRTEKKMRENGLL